MHVLLRSIPNIIIYERSQLELIVICTVPLVGGTAVLHFDKSIQYHHYDNFHCLSPHWLLQELRAGKRSGD